MPTRSATAGSAMPGPRGPVRRRAAALVAAAATAALLAPAGAPRAEDKADEIRGAEVPARHADDALRALADGILYLPRLAVHGVLAASGFGVEATADARLIARTRNLLRFLERGGVYPRVSLSSESFPALGANVFYRGTGFGAIAGGAYSNRDFWDTSAHVSWQGAVGPRLLKVTLTGEESRLDDLIFHGIGPRPRSDSRNTFLAGATRESGRYLQHREAVNMVAGLRTAGDVELFLDVLLHERSIRFPED
ncbi:MAG TPA: hypothetical protein VKU85_20470, partial [bacterium]|nr:hypothetical protein [bacterium]